MATLQIPAPRANYGDAVIVKNYRRRPPVWERGSVAGLAWKNAFGDFAWQYDVVVERQVEGQTRGLRLFVGDEGIERLDGRRTT